MGGSGLLWFPLLIGVNFDIDEGPETENRVEAFMDGELNEFWEVFLLCRLGVAMLLLLPLTVLLLLILLLLLFERGFGKKSGAIEDLLEVDELLFPDARLENSKCESELCLDAWCPNKSGEP